MFRIAGELEGFALKDGRRTTGRLRNNLREIRDIAARPDGAGKPRDDSTLSDAFGIWQVSWGQGRR